MRCSKCGTDNAAGSRFCNQCATPLGKPCPKCAHENISEAKFCAQCAAPLDVTEPIRVDAEPRDTGLTGERRHLTVLFCDLVGSTEIAAQLDPEEWRVIVADYHRAVGQAVERFGGYVAQYLGDGVMAYFGPRRTTTTPNAPREQGWRSSTPSRSSMNSRSVGNCRRESALIQAR